MMVHQILKQDDSNSMLFGQVRKLVELQSLLSVEAFGWSDILLSCLCSKLSSQKATVLLYSLLKKPESYHPHAQLFPVVIDTPRQRRVTLLVWVCLSSRTNHLFLLCIFSAGFNYFKSDIFPLRGGAYSLVSSQLHFIELRLRISDLNIFHWVSLFKPGIIL